MPSLFECSLDWLNQAEKALKTAKQLTDREAKEVMVQLGELYLFLTQTALTQAAAREFSLVTQLGMPQRCNAATA